MSLGEIVICIVIRLQHCGFRKTDLSLTARQKGMEAATFSDEIKRSTIVNKYKREKIYA